MYFNKKGFKNPVRHYFHKSKHYKTTGPHNTEGHNPRPEQLLTPGSADSGNPDFCFQIPLQRALCTVLNSPSTGGDGQAGATAPSKSQPQVPAVAWPIWQLPGNLPIEDHLFPDHPLSTLVPVKNNQCLMCNTRDTDYYVENTEAPWMCCTAQGKITIILQ